MHTPVAHLAAVYIYISLKQNKTQNTRAESTHKVRVTIGDSGLCCCTCVMYFEC